jgi:hypothetical protein
MTAGVFILCRNTAETVSKKGLLKKWDNPSCFASTTAFFDLYKKAGGPFSATPPQNLMRCQTGIRLQEPEQILLYSSSSFSPTIINKVPSLL